MKRDQKKLSELQLDDKVQSRMGLKNKLYNMGGGDFDLSLFTESNNQHQRFSSMFPQINEPTLEDSQPGEHLKVSDDSGLEQYYGQGITARNSYEKSKSNSQIYLLEMKVDQLTQQLAKQDSQLNKYKNTNQILKKQMERMQNDLLQKGEIIQRQRKEISSIKYKQLVVSEYESKSSLSTKSLMEDSLNNFCAELLSPEQTVELLTQLLKKVSKSSKMIRHLTSDATTRQILLKINKH